jgi:hypothetical protein
MAKTTRMIRVAGGAEFEVPARAVKRDPCGREFVILPNGCQAMFHLTGGAGLPKPRKPDAPPPPAARKLTPKQTAAADVADRQTAFQGEEPAELRNNVFDELKPPTAADHAAERASAFKAPEGSPLGKDANAAPKSAQRRSPPRALASHTGGRDHGHTRADGPQQRRRQRQWP